MIKKWEPSNQDEQKTIYEGGPVYFIKAKAGAVLADHTHDFAETLWIIEGKGKVLIGDETEDFEAPCVIEFSAHVYHKFMPDTDVKFIELQQEV